MALRRQLSVPCRIGFVQLRADGIGRFSPARFWTSHDAGRNGTWSAIAGIVTGRRSDIRVGGKFFVRAAGDSGFAWIDVKSRGKHDPGNYAAGVKPARVLRKAGSDGIVYDSVCDPSGECVVAFCPGVVAPCAQAKHLVYRWDGTRIAQLQAVLELARNIPREAR